MFTQENWEVEGQEGGNGMEKQEKGKKIKAQPKASWERRALGHILGRGLSHMSLRLCPLIRGGGENDHPLPVITASGILSTRNWLTATGC